jgi:hypothetical protein
MVVDNQVRYSIANSSQIYVLVYPTEGIIAKNPTSD